MLGPLALLAAVLPAAGGFVLLGYMSSVSEWLRSHQETGLAIYISGFIVLAGLALLPTYAQSLLAGFAFGVWVGVPAALAGFTGASLLAYVITVNVAQDRLTKVLESKPKWNAVYRALLGQSWARTWLLVVLIRLPPNSPFALTNLVLASARVPVSAYVLGTLVGMLPRSALAVGIGASLTQFSAAQPMDWRLSVGGIVSTLIVVLIIGTLAQRALKQMAERPSEERGSHSR